MNLIRRIICVACQIALLPFGALGQGLPIDDGNWGGFTNRETPDTIIQVPFHPIGGTGSHVPALTIPTCVLYWNHHLIFEVSPNASFSYAVYDLENTLYFHGRFSASTIIDISTLPSGHYTLFLYINKECFEGEFYKE